MATLTQLPSRKWRAQVRRMGTYRAATFSSKAQARAWAAEVEKQLEFISASGYAPPPKGATLGDLIESYVEQVGSKSGRTKLATLRMLHRKLGGFKLNGLSAIMLRDFVDQRLGEGAGGVTVAADLSFLSAVLKWGKYSRRLDLPERLPLEARESLKYQGINTRGRERSREPTDEELHSLYELWRNQPRRQIHMEIIVRFALATGMRLGEICRLQIEDVNPLARTVLIRDRKDPRNKVGNNQTVPLLPNAWDIVGRQMLGRVSGNLFAVKAPSVSSAFTRGCTSLGIEDLRFHDLRHRATADFFRAGLDIPRVALLTGHKTWAMLKRYTDMKPADVHLAYRSPKHDRTENATEVECIR